MTQTTYMCSFKKSETGQPAQMSRDKLHSYWRNPDEMNNPSTYLESGKQSEYLVSLVKQHAGTDAWVIELGCNVGRNLHYLWGAGYRSHSGEELNEQAIKLMYERFPDLKPTIYQGALVNGQYDLVFTMAALEHIHRDSVGFQRAGQDCLKMPDDHKGREERLGALFSEKLQGNL